VVGQSWGGLTPCGSWLVGTLVSVPGIKKRPGPAFLFITATAIVLGFVFMEGHQIHDYQISPILAQQMHRFAPVVQGKTILGIAIGPLPGHGLAAVENLDLPCRQCPE